MAYSECLHAPCEFGDCKLKATHTVYNVSHVKHGEYCYDHRGTVVAMLTAREDADERMPAPAKEGS